MEKFPQPVLLLLKQTWLTHVQSYSQ